MKKLIIISILLSFFATGATLLAQNRQDESLGLPGDNLNLYAVMKLFQESETLEGFEKNLNDPNSNINNLDLNGDNLVDYIRVIDNIDGDVHNIVLQVSINRRENQDVAVFTVQRDSHGRVYVQLTGDEALYGRDYIIEPILDDSYAAQTPNPGYMGSTSTIDDRNVTIYRTTAFEIASWPLIRCIYLPGYYPWRSAWYWGYYPSYWHPWRPFYWDYYYGYHYNWYNDYYAHYRHIDYRRYNRWNDYYLSGRRSYSAHVSTGIEAGNYRNTYSRPEERRVGETAFLRKYPDQNRRAVGESSDNRVVRRSVSPAIERRQSVDNSTARRSTNTISNRSVTNPQTRQNDVTARRSSNTETNRQISNPQSRQNEITTRRSTNTETNRSISNPQSRQNEVASRRPTNTITNRSGAAPQPERNSVTNRSSRQSSSGNIASTRRSSNSNNSAANSNKSEKTKSSETRNESRRK
jgi:hypothetical protein